MWIVGAEAKLENTQRLLPQLPEQHGIDGGVVVLGAFVAPMPGHNATHLRRSECLNTADLAWHPKGRALGKAVDDGSRVTAERGGEAGQVRAVVPPAKAKVLKRLCGKLSPQQLARGH